MPDSQAGAAPGIYKIASSLSNAIGVAISAALYVAGQAVDPALVQPSGHFVGRQDTVALRFGGGIGLSFNVVMVVVAIAAIIVTVPSQRKGDAAEAMAEPPERREKSRRCGRGTKTRRCTMAVPPFAGGDTAIAFTVCT